MKIALAVDDEGTGLAVDFASCRSVLVFDLEGNRVTGEETRTAALYVPLEVHPLLSLLEDCSVLFAAGFDAESLHAIGEAGVRPLVVSDGSLTVGQILRHLEGETLKVRAPILHTHDEEDVEQEDQSE